MREERRKLGRLSRGEKNTLLVLAFALIGWFLPGLVGIVAGDDSNAYTQVQEASNEGIVAILAATLLFVLPVDWKKRKFTLNWNQASQIDWGTVILFGGGLVLGSLLSQTGPRRGRRQLAVRLARRVEPVRHHGRGRDRRGARLRDDEQHGQRGDHGADRDLDRRRV